MYITLNSQLQITKIMTDITNNRGGPSGKPTKWHPTNTKNLSKPEIKHSNRAFYLTKHATNKILAKCPPMTDREWGDIAIRLLYMTEYIELGYQNRMMSMRDLDWSILTKSQIGSHIANKAKREFDEILQNYKEMLDLEVGDESMWVAAAES
jgi:hypothetical protein